MRTVRITLTATFLLLIAVTAGSIWLLADFYNKKNTDQLVAQIHVELSHRIDLRIRELLAIPHQLNGMSGRIVQNPPGDEQEHAIHFFHSVLQAYPHVNALFLGSQDGSMGGARWSSDGSRVEIMLTNAETGGALDYFRIDDDGTPLELVESAPDYDPRNRLWYSDAVDTDGPVWSPIYLDFATKALVMTAAQPLYNSNRDLLGVLGCGLQFKQINQFLQTMDVGNAGVAYLMELDGNLISDSSGGPSFQMDGETPTRVQAVDSPNDLIRQSARGLRERFGTLDQIPDESMLSIELATGLAYGSTFHITDKFGLDWLGVIVVPEEGYMAIVRERNQVATYVLLLVIVGVLLAGLISAHFLTRPLTQLSEAARRVTRGSWDAPLATERRDEFGEVARAFDTMLTQVRARIEELQTTRNALRESEDRYARAQEAARVVTWTWDFATDEIEWMELSEPIIGGTPGINRIKAPSYLRNVHQEDRDYVIKCLDEALNGQQDFDIEHRLMRSDNVMRWVSSKGDVLRQEDGTPTAFIGVVQDISERKRLESQLRQAQKMDAVGRLAGGVAHDFNNLLQAILGFAEIARDSLSPANTAHDDLTEIMSAATRATELVSQLLAFSRRQLLRLDNIALDAVVQEMGKMLSRLIDETITLQLVLPEQEAVIRADRTQVEQILMNLCVNARDSMPDGGTLKISVGSVTLRPEDSESQPWARPGDYHFLRVCDTGSGMDDGTLSHVFEPFFTTKEVGKGTGLGLATVYGIVEQHNGLIHVVSEMEQGTTFEVYFPAQTGEIKHEIAPAPVAAPGGGETILVAEDDSAVRQLARRILERAGYTVIIAVDGSQAIALFEEHRENIDAAFLDVVMPGKNGKAVLEHLKSRSPHLPVMFASGYAEAGVHTDFVLEEGLKLIQKPYTPQTVLESLREILHVSPTD